MTPPLSYKDERDDACESLISDHYLSRDQIKFTRNVYIEACDFGYKLGHDAALSSKVVSDVIDSLKLMTKIHCKDNCLRYYEAMETYHGPICETNHEALAAFKQALAEVEK